jgi:ribosomal protein L39E
MSLRTVRLRLLRSQCSRLDGYEPVRVPRPTPLTEDPPELVAQPSTAGCSARCRAIKRVHAAVVLRNRRRVPRRSPGCWLLLVRQPAPPFRSKKLVAIHTKKNSEKRLSRALRRNEGLPAWKREVACAEPFPVAARNGALRRNGATRNGRYPQRAPAMRATQRAVARPPFGSKR